MNPSFAIGTTVDNETLRNEFRCSTQGGMRRSLITNTLVLISKKGLYDDRWNGDIFYYTGMGQLGDQSLDYKQNKTLAESKFNGVEVHLFEGLENRRYTYRGIVELAGEPFKEKQRDKNGTVRAVYVFPLRMQMKS